jgi:hypothetical protein
MGVKWQDCIMMSLREVKCKVNGVVSDSRL